MHFSPRTSNSSLIVFSFVITARCLFQKNCEHCIRIIECVAVRLWPHVDSQYIRFDISFHVDAPHNDDKSSKFCCVETLTCIAAYIPQKLRLSLNDPLRSLLSPTSGHSSHHVVAPSFGQRLGYPASLNTTGRQLTVKCQLARRPVRISHATHGKTQVRPLIHAILGAPAQ